MNKENYESISSVIRTLLSLTGAYLLGTNLFGIDANESFWQELTGSVMGLISIVWSIKTKCATIEMIQGTIREVISFIGGLFVALGHVSAQTVVFIIGTVSAILPAIYAHYSRKKSQQLATGEIKVSELKK